MLSVRQVPFSLCLGAHGCVACDFPASGGGGGGEGGEVGSGSNIQERTSKSGSTSLMAQASNFHELRG